MAPGWWWVSLLPVSYPTRRLGLCNDGNRRISRSVPRRARVLVIALASSIGGPHLSLNRLRDHAPVLEAHQQFRLDLALAAGGVTEMAHFALRRAKLGIRPIPKTAADFDHIPRRLHVILSLVRKQRAPTVGPDGGNGEPPGRCFLFDYIRLLFYCTKIRQQFRIF